MGWFNKNDGEIENKPEAEESADDDDVKGPELFDDFQLVESFDPTRPVIVVCASGETFVGRFEGKDFIMRPVKIEAGNQPSDDVAADH